MVVGGDQGRDGGKIGGARRREGMKRQCVCVTSQNVGQLRGRLEGLLCIASKITGFFRAFVSKT
jgi:hypothetical protein